MTVTSYRFPSKWIIFSIFLILLFVISCGAKKRSSSGSTKALKTASAETKKENTPATKKNPEKDKKTTSITEKDVSQMTKKDVEELISILEKQTTLDDDCERILKLARLRKAELDKS